jgi:hypothetical protein
MGIFSRRDKDGYDRDGYDRKGFGRDGYDSDGIGRDGYDRKGYDSDGYDRDGWSKSEIYKHTGTLYDKYGYTKNDLDRDGFGRDGLDEEGYDRDGIGRDRFDGNGYDRKGYDSDGYNKKGYNREGRDSDGYDRDGYDRDGHDRKGYDKNGYDSDGFGRGGYDSNGYDSRGFEDATEINRLTKTKFDDHGFNKYWFNIDGIHRLTKTKFDDAGYDKNGYDSKGYDKNGYDSKGYDKNGYDSDGIEQFNITSKFSKIISSFNSNFDAFVTLEYNEPTKIQTKSFFSHGEKTGIYSKAFESFSNNNVVHFHIEKAGKQYGTTWNKPKDTGRLQGDNFETGYTLIVNFNKNDSELKSVLIKKLGKLNFGSLPSEYTLDCHLNEEHPNDERAKELLQTVVELFNTEHESSRGTSPKGFDDPSTAEQLTKIAELELQIEQLTKIAELELQIEEKEKELV